MTGRRGRHGSVLQRALRLGLGWGLCVAAVSCGGGGGSFSGGGGGGSSTGPVTPAANVVSVAVSGGPTNSATNLLFTTVKVCVPGSTTNCQTIGNILVDTGSTGLRLLAPVLTLTLPVATQSSGTALAECYGYVDGYAWGPVALVDLTISSESAKSVPVQLIGDPRYPTVPADCSGLGMAEDTVATFGANGILGIGFQVQDCGALCAGTAVPAAYYACTSASCDATTVAVADQVQNPVTMFAKDNNGTIITLASVANGGAATVAGSLIFGLDTQSNNASSSTTVLTVDGNPDDADYGDFTVLYNGQTLSESFIDSGSNGYYFNDSSIPACPSPNEDFYCPSSTTTYSASVESFGSSASTTFSFIVANADAQPSADTAYPGLAGTTTLANNFDLGLPFYFGRRVVTAIQGYSTSSGTGPYVAY